MKSQETLTLVFVDETTSLLKQVNMLNTFFILTPDSWPPLNENNEMENKPLRIL